MQIYLAPYHAASGGMEVMPCGSTISAFRQTVASGEWPYDYGDDPSFHAMRQFETPLSWGVCRQDVRNNLEENDVVVFFSYFKSNESGESEYRLCAVATVQKKVSQIEIWNDPDLSKFRNYHNLLIRPNKVTRGRWDHYEPSMNHDNTRIHNDWLWRIADHKGTRKSCFQKIEAENSFNSTTEIAGMALTVAKNYVVFSSEESKTCVLENPPIIAFHTQGKPAEEWNTDSISQRVKALTIDRARDSNGKMRWLRIRNSQRAHRHIVFKMSTEETTSWRYDFLRLIRKL